VLEELRNKKKKAQGLKFALADSVAEAQAELESKEETTKS